MRAVVQRVQTARVEVEGEITGQIGMGLLVYLGAGVEDSEADADWMASKVEGLRIFEDPQGKMGLSVADVKGALLVVSQFTLYGDVRKGRRPSFDKAAAPERAVLLYERFCDVLRSRGHTVATGRFRAEMIVHAEVQGPVTILVDSERVF